MNHLYHKYLKALEHPTHPELFLDLDHFHENINWVLQNAGNKKIRLATKSLRSKDIIKKILDSNNVFQGLMTYDLREALWLRSEGFKDILMGYPTYDLIALKELLKDPSEITLMVDLPEHLSFLDNLASQNNTTLSICLDIDLSMNLPGLRFGVFRSFVNSKKRLMNFLNAMKKTKYLKLTGLMGYEAQIAGVMDKNSPIIQFLKKRSIKELQKRREDFFKIIQTNGHELKFINGGGTGSLKDTILEKVVTEVTIGSGFYSPVLFDNYKNFKLKPALAFTLPIVRSPEKNIYTCAGGGYIASGSTESIKSPAPYLPEGLKLLKHEGAGEVQTPLQYTGHLPLVVGDSVIMRHAKAGEVCERFSEIKIIQGDSIVEVIKTYRGEGKTFL